MVKLRTSEDPRILWEVNIHEIVNVIRNKPQWWEKYQDEEIFNRWKEEVRTEFTENPSNGRYRFLVDQIDETFDAVEVQLDYYRELREKTLPFVTGPEDDIMFGDDIVPKDVKEQLSTLVKEKLETGPKDWHPGSDEKVLDLVHPSLYPVEFGKTPLKDGSIAKRPKHLLDRQIGPQFAVYSGSQFQWIPALFNISKDDNDKHTAEIGSYINNLHPEQQAEFYPVIASIFQRAIPGLEMVLSNAQIPNHVYAEIPDMSELRTQQYYELEDKYMDGEMSADDWNKLNDEHGPEYLDHIELNWTPKEIPDVLNEKFQTPEQLKVIVKLANIELTPEKPTYDGGTWHLEGTALEDICATILYYYDCENIANSRLSFRASYEPNDIPYEQYDKEGTMMVWGLEDDQLALRNVGSLDCIEDRFIVFPNVYQHHVDSFELADPSKPGHRKILAFFVCNPDNSKVISSDQVPYQQKEWNDEGTMDWSQACETRERLMAERGAGELGEAFDDIRFSLCEH